MRGKSFCAVKELLAAGRPKPDVMSTIVVQSEQCILASSPAEVSRRAMSPSWVEPLSPVRFAVTMTVSRETRDKLKRARDLMRHRNPGNDIAVVFDRALDGLLPRLEKERRGAAKRPRCSGPAGRGGNVSRGARRDVFARASRLRGLSQARFPELRYRQAVRAVDGMTDSLTRWLMRNHRGSLVRSLKHADERIRQYAQAVASRTAEPLPRWFHDDHYDPPTPASSLRRTHVRKTVSRARSPFHAWRSAVSVTRIARRPRTAGRTSRWRIYPRA